MQIEFPDSEPVYSPHNLTMTFEARVDGRTVPCAISVEALEDHFGAQDCNLDGWRRAFMSGRRVIEAAARQHLPLSNGAPVLLKSGHFPPGSAIPVYRNASIHARSV
jgi:hypothetical protein